MESFLKITETEASSYGRMKVGLNMKTDEQFLKYMRVKTINQFNQKNLIIGVNPTIEIPKANAGNKNAQDDDKPRLLKAEEQKSKEEELQKAGTDDEQKVADEEAQKK